LEIAPTTAIPLDEELRRDGIEMIAPHRSNSQQACHARWTPAEAIRKAVGGRALLRMGSMAASHPRPMGVLPTKLPRLCSTRLLANPLQAILR
jgi:hypothetical protein